MDSPSVSEVISDAKSSISTVHSDVIQTHILTRLDGPSLVSASCASSHLRHVSTTDDNLWKNICTATWPSLDDPLLRHVISTFPNGHRSVFSDSFPSLHHTNPNPSRSLIPSTTTELIWAVDMYYKEKPILSRVQHTEAQSHWFMCSPLWVDILDSKEHVATPVKYVMKDEELLKHLEENLSLSWIVIDPTRKRSANLSSRKPVSVERHWLTKDLEVVYAVVMARGDELVQWKIKVTCGGKVGGEMHVRGVSLMVEDMEGRHVNGKEGVGILQRVMENGKRKKLNGEETRRKYQKFLAIKRERKERKQRIEKVMDIISVVLIIVIFLFFSCFLFF